MNVIVKTTKDIGIILKHARNEAGFKQSDVAGLFNCGNSFIVDAENGKPTIQAQKLIDLLGLLGLEVVIREKSFDYGLPYIDSTMSGNLEILYSYSVGNISRMKARKMFGTHDMALTQMMRQAGFSPPRATAAQENAMLEEISHIKLT